MNNSKFLHSYKNLKVLVTGSTGFKGSWLCLWLNLCGAKVVGVGLKPESEQILFNAFELKKKIKQHFLDISNFNKINYVIKKEKPDIIFHLAAQSIVSLSYTNPLKTIETNVLGSANLLESVRINKVKNLVYITSDKSYLNREILGSYSETDLLGGYDNYSSSKACAELLFTSYHKSFFNKKKLQYATTRAGNVIGGGDFKKDRIVPDTIKSLMNNKNLIVRSPSSTRPWQHVLEPLSGYLNLGDKLLNKKLSSNILPSWNFGPNTKNCKTVLEIVKRIYVQWGADPKKIVIKRSNNFKEAKLLVLNINKSKKELKWKPRLSLNETIELTVNWYKNYFANKKMSKITIEQIENFKNISRFKIN